MPNTSRNHRSNGRQRETTGDRRETDGRRTGDDPSKRPRTDLKTWENASQAKLKFSFFEKKMLGKSEQKIYFLRFFCLPLVFQWVSSVSRCCLPLSPVVSRGAGGGESTGTSQWTPRGVPNVEKIFSLILHRWVHLPRLWVSKVLFCR